MVQNKNEFFSSVIGLGSRAHNLLQQMEIDKSCQTKVSVPINTDYIKDFVDEDGNMRESEYFSRKDRQGITWSLQVQGLCAFL